MRTSLVLDLAKTGESVPLGIWPRQGDAEDGVVEAVIQRDGEDADLAGYAATFVVVRADGALSTVPCDISGSKVSWGVTSAMTGAPGAALLAYLALTNGDVTSTTDNLTFEVMRAADVTGEQAGAYETLVDRLASQLASAMAEADEAERERAGAEAERASAESLRTQAETARAQNEASRQDAEASRVEAEQGRVTEFNTLKANAHDAANAANGAASNANASANSALQIANAVAQGSAGSSDVAALKGQVSSLGSMVADLKGEFYCMDGCVYAPSSKASRSGTTVTLAATCSASGTALTLA